MAETPSYNTLFVVLPNQETLTVRKLSDCITWEYLKAKLELVTGIHGNAIKLSYGATPLVEDLDLHFGGNIRNGGLLKILISEELLELYLAVCASNIQNIIHGCIAPEADTCSDLNDSESALILNTEDKSFFSLLVACRQGNLHVIRTLLNLDTEGRWKKQCTRFGRTLAHVAVASDHTKILDFLIKHDASIQTEDCFSNTPLDVAVIHGAYTCERLIRQSLPRRTSAHRKRVLKPPGKNIHLKVCWNDTPWETKVNTKLCEPDDQSDKQLNMLQPSSHISGMALSSSRQGSACRRVTAPSRTSYAPKLLGTKSVCISSPSQTCKVKCAHKKCLEQPPFIAFRSVGQEELRPVAVEYVPLETCTYTERHQRLKSKVNDNDRTQDYPRAPNSSLNNSTEDLSQNNSEKKRLLKKRNELIKRYTNVKGSSTRIQSAKYYRTRYHLEAEFDISIPKPRPATAGPRYRAWKVWLLEKMAMDAEKAESDELNGERKMQNELAFKKWLARHKYHDQYSEDTDSDEDGSDYDDENEKAYQLWTESKQTEFETMDKKRRERMKNNGDEDEHNKINRRITIYELGLCNDEPAEPPKPEHYMRAYQTWKHTKKSYESWRRRKGLPIQRKTQSKEEFIKTRDTLLMQGMTYSEWLGLKTREQPTTRLHIQRF